MIFGVLFVFDEFIVVCVSCADRKSSNQTEILKAAILYFAVV